MATIQVHSLKGKVQDAINYIIQESKTEAFICESKNCNMHCAGIQWKLEHEKGQYKRPSIYDDVVGYHFRQSFAADTVSKEEAFDIAKEWIEKILGNNHDYVIATHIDKKHIHTHIIVNPYSNVDGKKLRIFYKRDLKLFKDLSDEICLKHGLDILGERNAKYEKSYYEWMKKNSGDNHKDILRKAIDAVIGKVKDYDEFKSYLSKLGFIVEDGSEKDNNRKGLRIKIPNGKNMIRCNRLNKNEDGLGYTMEEIIKRIENNGVFITIKEVKDFLAADLNKSALEKERLSFYENCNIRISYKDSVFYTMSPYEKMIFAKRNNINKILKDIHEMNLKVYGISNLDVLKENRKQLQDRIDEITYQLKSNETALTQMMEQQMDDTLDISDSQLNDYIATRILPLREERENLKEEISKISEIINKSDQEIKKSKTFER